MFSRLTRLYVGIIAGAAITMGMILVPTSAMASAAQTAGPFGQTAGTFSLVNNSNGWCLDGRENGVGGVHMAPCGSDTNTQTWSWTNGQMLTDSGNGWCLDGRENGDGGVHMAPCGSDTNTQTWHTLPLSGNPFALGDAGNPWYLDGRENCCGGVHMAPYGTDPATQQWDE